MMQKVLLTEMCFCKEKKFAALVVGRQPTLCSHIKKKIKEKEIQLNLKVNLNNNLESTKITVCCF